MGRGPRNVSLSDSWRVGRVFFSCANLEWLLGFSETSGSWAEAPSANSCFKLLCFRVACYTIKGN